jgi:Copper transport outer membrane protein, MctB
VFDLRYHVASLAAVFFALVIGILVGVALASHGLGNTERNRLQRQIDVANANVKAAKDRLTDATDASRADAAFVDSAYDTVMRDRLQGRHIAVLFIGSVGGELLKSVNRTLTDADAPPRLRLRAITVPVDDAAIDRTLDGRPQLASYTGPDKLDDLGRELADEFGLGGDTPVWDALQNELVEERNGGMRRPADGVVIVRTAQPQADGTARFLHGLFSGLADDAIPVVGVEATDSKPSAVPVFRRYSLSTVDDVDTKVGRVALAQLLAGASGGAYGTKKTAADGVLPDVAQANAPATGG